MIRIPMNIPNMLTMLRFALVPVATILIYFDMMIPALITYLLACATDLLDGFLARRMNLVTNEGILLDPLADKLMAIFVIIAFTVTGVLPVFVFVIVLIKELLMVGGGIFLYFRDVITPANTYGKIAAFTFNTSIGFTFLHKIVTPWHQYFMYFALLFLIAALVQYAYFNMYKKFVQKKNNQKKTAQ